MKKYMSFIIASVLALLLAIGFTARINSRKTSFDKVVKEALSTSEGYDQRFIDMVNRLEHELTLRASFGYIGQKDPMTGKERIVVQQITPQRRPARAGQTVETRPEEEIDKVKLTAIIFDDTKRIYTAIVMDGERSYAVEVGDRVADRSITKITNDRIFMEDQDDYYYYDIAGKKGKRPKESVVPPARQVPGKP